MSSLSGCLILGDLESVDPDLVGVSGTDHGVLSLNHEDSHVSGSLVSTVGSGDGKLSLSDEDDLSSDSLSSLAVGNLSAVYGNVVGSDGSKLGSAGLEESSHGELTTVYHKLEVGDHSVSVDDGNSHLTVSDSHGSSGKSRASSVVDHEGVGLSGSDVSSLGLSKSDELESESTLPSGMGDSLKSLGSESKLGSSDDLDAPAVDDSSIVGHGSSGVSLGDVLKSEGSLSSGSGNSSLADRGLEDELGSESELVHSKCSSLTTDSLSVVVEGNALGMLSELGLTDKASLGGKLDPESSSHDSGSSSESLDRGGSLGFSSVLGLKGTSSHELGVSSGTDGSLLLGVGVSSGLDGDKVSGISSSVSSDGTSLGEESEALSSHGADLSLLPHHHGDVGSSQSGVSLTGSPLHVSGSLFGNGQLSHVVSEESDSSLHESPFLVGDDLHALSSGDLDSKVSSSSDHAVHLERLSSEHSTKVVLGVSERDSSSSHNDGDSGENDLGSLALGSHANHAVLGGDPSESPLGHVDLEAMHGLLGLLPFDVDLSHPLAFVLHHFSGKDLLGLVGDRDPESLRLFVSVDGASVLSESELEHMLGRLVVSVSLLLEDFHLVSGFAGLDHGDVHEVIGVLGPLSLCDVVHPVLGGNANFDGPVLD